MGGSVIFAKIIGFETNGDDGFQTRFAQCGDVVGVQHPAFAETAVPKAKRMGEYRAVRFIKGRFLATSISDDPILDSVSE